MGRHPRHHPGIGGQTIRRAASFLPPLETSYLWIEVPLPHLLLEVHDDVHGSVEDSELVLRLVRLLVGHADSSKLFQSETWITSPRKDELALAYDATVHCVIVRR